MPNVSVPADTGGLPKEVSGAVINLTDQLSDIQDLINVVFYACNALQDDDIKRALRTTLFEAEQKAIVAKETSEAILENMREGRKAS